MERWFDVDDIERHLQCRGFKDDYHVWYWHGEKFMAENDDDNAESSDLDSFGNDGMELDDDDDEEEIRMDERIDGMGDHVKGRPEVLDNLYKAIKTPLYPGCTKHSKLSGVLTLYNLKVRYAWSDTSFTSLLEMLGDNLPEGNDIPTSTYYAQKLMCPFGLDYIKIDACPNNCILYRKEYENLDECPKCKTSRFKSKESCSKKNGPSAKVLWNLPIIPRFRRLFATEKDAKNLRWHDEGRKKDGKVRHPADSLQWRTIDKTYPQFSGDIRNLRLSLCSDGINPYGTLSSQWSTWPVLLSIYNLPPWLCMKRKYMMLSLLIPGPKQPRNDIDVYLDPQGVQMYDVHTKTTFTLRAMIFCTINDFSAYGNLSGYKTKGEKACPISIDEMEPEWLDY